MPLIGNCYTLEKYGIFDSLLVSRRQRSCLGGERYDEHQEQMWMMRGVICCWWLFRSHQIVYLTPYVYYLGNKFDLFPFAAI
jgi:hypothetical protein